MSKTIKDRKELVTQINKITREIRLSQEEEFGRPVSKSWDERPSNKQKRRQIKEKLRHFTADDEFDDLME
jgi:hypothetical protein